MFQKLADIIVKHHKKIIIIWIIIVLLTAPAFLLVEDVLVYEETEMAPPDVESSIASEIKSEQFPRDSSNSTMMVVVEADDITSSDVRDFTIQLENNVRNSQEIQYIDNYTSIYSIYQAFIGMSVSELAPMMYYMENATNMSALMIYGVPAMHMGAWIGANATGLNVTESDAAASTQTMAYLSGFIGQAGLNATEQGMIFGYYSTFGMMWNSTALNASNPTDPLSNPPARAQNAIDQAVQAFTVAIPDEQISQMMIGVWTNFNITTWSNTTLIHNYMIGTIAAFSGITDMAFLEGVYQLGEQPTPAEIHAFSQGIIENGTFTSYPFQLPSAYQDGLVNETSDVMLIIIGFTREITDDAMPLNVAELRDIIQEIKPDTLEAYVTGDALGVDLEDAAKKDIALIEPVTVILVFILIGFFFMSFVTPFIPVGSIGLAFMVSQGFIVVIGMFMASIHYSTLTVMLAIMLGAGCDYAIFIMARYREERIKGKNREEGLHEAVTWAGESIATSGAAVMIGFGALSVGSFAMMQTMGLAIALGIGVAILVSLTFIPSLIMLLGNKIFWPSNKKWKKAYQDNNNNNKKNKMCYFEKSARFSIKHAKAIVLAALLISIPTTYVVLTTDLSYDFIAGMPETESVHGLNVLTDGFGGGRIQPTEIIVEMDGEIYSDTTGLSISHLDSIERLCENISNLDNIQDVSSPTRPFGGQGIDYHNAAQMAQYEMVIREKIGETDNSIALITVILHEEPFAPQSINSISQLRDTAGNQITLDTNIENVLVGGTTASMYDIKLMLDTDFQMMMFIVIIGMFVLLLLVLGSVLIPIRLILTILLSISWTLALAIIIFQHFMGIPMLWMMPMILFVMAMGLGMDYDIFLTTRIREEVVKGKSDEEAIVEAVTRTGPIITILGVVMATAFGTMMLSSLGLLQLFGFGLAVVVLIDATIVRIYIVPAIMMLAKKWNWWAPGRLQRVRREDKDKVKSEQVSDENEIEDTKSE